MDVRGDWRRYFPAGSLDQQADSHRRLAEWFTPFLLRMGEEPLWPGAAGRALVVRLLCLPTWTRACMVRLGEHGLSFRLFVRELTGEAGFDLGRLVRRDDRLLSSADADRVWGLWPYLHFWSLPGRAVTDDDVLDGTTYVLEAAEGERYHVAYRDDPEWGDTFDEFCSLLLSLGQLKPR